jgi:hypothetical protein
MNEGTPAGTLSTLLARDRDLRAAGRADPALDSHLTALRRWQAARLSATYADLGSQPRYVAAIQFFLDELYGAHDVSPRDHDLSRASHLLERALPDGALHALERAIDLEILSQELDLAMAGALPRSRPITGRSYADAYRRVGRRADRERQIAALVDLGAYLDALVRKPGLKLLVRMARSPAHAAGFGALHDFLESGFEAFSRLGGAGEFLATIQSRETRLLERLYAGDPDPFDGASS